MFFWNSFAFFDAPTDVGNLISGLSAFSKSNLYIWKFSIHILLKPSLKDFEHYLASMWNERNCVVVWMFFGIALLYDWNENWPLEKTLMLGKIESRRRKRVTEDEMVGWHHRLSRHEFEQTLRESEGKGRLACCSPWGHKQLDTTEQLNNDSKCSCYQIIFVIIVVEVLLSTCKLPGNHYWSSMYNILCGYTSVWAAQRVQQKPKDSQIGNQENPSDWSCHSHSLSKDVLSSNLKNFFTDCSLDLEAVYNLLQILHFSFYRNPSFIIPDPSHKLSSNPDRSLPTALPPEMKHLHVYSALNNYDIVQWWLRQ